MLETAPNRPGEIADLQAILAVRDKEIAAGKAEIRVRDLLIEKLKHQLAGMRRHRFGASSEALDQLALTLEDEEIATSAQDDANPVKANQPAAPKDKPKRKPLPGHLPRKNKSCRRATPVGIAAANSKNLATMSPRNWNLSPDVLW